MDVHDRAMLYYRLLKHDVKEAQRVICGQTKMVATENTVIPRVSSSAAMDCSQAPTTVARISGLVTI